MDLSFPANVDADLDWSDAGFYGFLESLSDSNAPPEKMLGMESNASMMGAQPNSTDGQGPSGTLMAAAPPGSLLQAEELQMPPQAAHQMSLGLAFPMDAHLLPASLDQQAAATPPGAQDSGSSGASGEQAQHGQAHNATARRKSSNSGDEGAKGMGVHKSGPDRDKNRAAQRAFRQRKKEQEKAKEELVGLLEAKLKAVQLEKARLEMQNSQLEHALLARVTAAARPNALQIATVDKALSGRIITGGADWKCNLDWGPTDVLVLERGVQQRLTAQTLEEMGVPGIARLWKCFVNQIAACLAGAWKDEQGPDGVKVQVLLSECISICAYMARNCPKMLYQFASSRLDDNPLAPAAPTVALWNALLKNMRLSEDQAAELLQRRRLFLTQIGSLLEERRRIQATIKDMDFAADSLALRYCQLREATKQLHSNVTALHDSKCRFFSACWREVLRPVQAANMVVQAFPFGPDLLAVLSCLSEEAAEPTAQELLRGDS